MAEKRMVEKWFAFDGTEHQTESAADAHDEANFESIICGLTIEQVRAALSREPGHIAIADAMEKAGTTIARRRLAAGERRRARKGEDKTDAPSASTGSVSEPVEGETSGAEQEAA